MTKHAARDGSRFDWDIGKLDEMIDYLECYLMYPENNPINKKDIDKMCRRIRNMSEHMMMKVREKGYSYFEDLAPEGYNAI